MLQYIFFDEGKLIELNECRLHTFAGGLKLADSWSSHKTSRD